MAVMVVVCAVEQGGHEASSVTETGAGSQARLRGDLRGGEGGRRGWRGGMPSSRRLFRTESHREQSPCPAVGPALRAGTWIERRSDSQTRRTHMAFANPSVSRSMPRAARPTASQTLPTCPFADSLGRLSLSSVTLCAKYPQCLLLPLPPKALRALPPDSPLPPFDSKPIITSV